RLRQIGTRPDAAGSGRIDRHSSQPGPPQRPGAEPATAQARQALRTPRRRAPEFRFLRAAAGAVTASSRASWTTRLLGQAARKIYLFKASLNALIAASEISRISSSFWLSDGAADRFRRSWHSFGSEFERPRSATSGVGVPAIGVLSNI